MSFLSNKKTFDKNKTVKYKLQRKEKTDRFDINIVDKYSLNDLIKIRESIQKALTNDTSYETEYIDKTYSKK